MSVWTVCLLATSTLSAQLAIPPADVSAEKTSTEKSPAEQEVEEQSTPKPETVTTEQLDQLRKQIESATDVDEEARKKLLDTWQKAADALSRAAKLEAQAPLDQASIEAIGTRFKELQAELAQPLPKPLADIAEEASLAELQSALAARQPKLQEAKQKLITQEAEPGRRIERRTAIVGDQATYATRKAELEKELAAPAPGDESALATAARRAFLLARLREIIAEAPANQAELSKYEASKAVDLPTLRIQQARREVTKLQQEVDLLTKRINAKRSQDARYIAEQLALFASGQPVPTPYDQNGETSDLFSGTLTDTDNLQMASETAELAQKNVEVTSQVTRATTEVSAALKKLESLRSLKSGIQKKIDRVGLTGAIGLDLRRQLRTLSDPAVLRRQCQARQEDMRDLEFERLDLEDQAELYAERIEDLTHEDSLTDAEAVTLRLAKDRYTTLTTLGRNSGEYFNRLGDLDATEQETIREIEEFSTFIREHVLWIRSNRWPGWDDVRELISSAQWFVSLPNWSGVGQSLWKDATANVGLYALYVVLISMLFLTQPRFRNNLGIIADTTSRSTCREFYPTARAAVLTLVLALAWPALTGFIGWRLRSDATATPFSRGVGEGFLGLTAGFLTFNLLRLLCRPTGLGLAHFEWPASSVRLLRASIYPLMIMLLPLVFLDATLHAQESPQSRDALQRVVFVLSLTLLAHFQARILHPQTGVFRDFLAVRTSGWVFRLRWPLYWIAVLLPLTLAGLAIVGFYYTAYELSWRLYVTSWILIGLFVLRCFLIRWFVVSHRRLRIEQARLRRQALAEEAQSEPNTSNIPKPSTQESTVDLQEVSEQTQQFINSALAFVCLVVMWFVWVDVLPALGILDRWELWPTTVEVMSEYTESDGSRNFRNEPQIQWVTVADAIIAVVLTVLTFTAARNIPGLLEITVLQRLPLEPASRYAFRMVARYLIVVLGLVFACGVIGVGWGQVQWLAAALTVGLGFGLQEIFANFVSGLIILFERPVRIGDIVTIAEVTGTVSRIQIRATTITDWNRKEYIVPNKEFVTGRLLNWTLSDTVNRVMISVGVAYGSDTARARELLLEVAHHHPEVLEDPPAVATFESFGDSTLNLMLRVYLANLEVRLQTVTELHEAIDAAFKAANIEISFPQRDLHIRSLPATFPGRQQSSDDAFPFENGS
ncbi:MAG: mechanosensitive ion channel [Planctomycetaceae bacterium]